MAAVASPLARRLAAELEGEVRFDDGSRALYATDASNYRRVPVGVVRPRSLEDVERTAAACREHGAALLPRGGGTSLAGQCCNAAVVIDFSPHLNRVLEIDPAARRARVEPGCVLDDLRSAAAPHGLTFGPDPSTSDRCTLGGMIGNNACGVHSVMAGRTADNVESLEILTADGERMRVGATDDAELGTVRHRGGRAAEIHRGLLQLRREYGDEVRERFPDIPRRVSGYNLDELLPERGFHLARALVGSEGTCATVLEATVRLAPDPPGRALAVVAFPDVYTAAEAVPAALEHGPVGLEGLDDVLVGNVRDKGMHPGALERMPDGAGWLLIEMGGGDDAEAEARAHQVTERLEKEASGARGAVVADRRGQAALWAVRRAALGATAFVPDQPDTWPGFEDAAVAPGRVAPYLRGFRALLDRYGYTGALYGHFGDGCIHTRISFDPATRDGRARMREFLGEAADLVVAHGGSLSGEHGDGQARAELLERMFGPRLVEAFRAFKAIWDPENRMNPGKVVDPEPLDAHLRLDGAFSRDAGPTHFAFPRDRGSFGRATLRCVGVGLCRRTEGGTMCPSYKVTHEEAHSTRGRARLLFEMLRDGPLRDGWRSEAVKEALDLCLACKGCLGDCPVNVDVGTYKAEFLSHYYERRLRPPEAYAMGLIAWWARAASRWPALANALAQSRLTAGLGKRLAGLAPERELPRFAPSTFRRGAALPAGPADGPRVLLWPDTFNDHFHPQVLGAAARVLAGAGARVTLPPATPCCGRPLYDFGMLDRARAWLARILEALEPELAAGAALVGVEPSCVAVFRDELPNLFPDDPRAARLRERTFTLAEWLARAPGYEPPRRRGRLLHQGHCHQDAVMGLDADRELLERTGVELETPDTGCCGMAGAFGYARESYPVSMAVAEHALVPALRAFEGDWVLSDGFSCRKQIGDVAGREPLHLAQWLDDPSPRWRKVRRAG